MEESEIIEAEELRENWKNFYRRKGPCNFIMASKYEALQRQIELLLMLHIPSMLNPFYYFPDVLAYKFRVDMNTIKNDFKTLKKLYFPREIRGILEREFLKSDRLKVFSVLVVENLLAKLIAEYIIKFRAESIFFDLDYRNCLSIIDNINRIINAILFKEIIKLTYRSLNQEIIEITVFPVEIVLTKSEIGFIGVNNGIVDIYEFKNVTSIVGISTANPKTYTALIKEFYKKSLDPTLNIKTKIIVKHKHTIEYFYISCLINKKTNSDGNDSEIFNFTLEDFAKWFADEYLPFVVIDLQKITRNVNDGNYRMYFLRYNISYKVRNVFRNMKFETGHISPSSSNDPETRRDMNDDNSLPKDILSSEVNHILTRSNPEITKTPNNNTKHNDNLDSISSQSCIIKELDPYRNKPYITETIEVNISPLNIYECFNPTLSSLWESFRDWFK